MQDYLSLLENQAREAKDSQKYQTLWLPAKINEKGEVDNMIQGRTTRKGPERGHWIEVNGKRVWKQGKGIYKRQQDPRTLEPILGTKKINDRIEFEVLRNESGQPIKEIDIDAKVISYGRVRKVKVSSTWDDIAAEAYAEAASILRRMQPTGLGESEQVQGSGS